LIDTKPPSKSEVIGFFIIGGLFFAYFLYIGVFSHRYQIPQQIAEKYASEICNRHDWPRAFVEEAYMSCYKDIFGHKSCYLEILFKCTDGRFISGNTGTILLSDICWADMVAWDGVARYRYGWKDSGEIIFSEEDANTLKQIAGVDG